jgi:hypothetical protein
MVPSRARASSMTASVENGTSSANAPRSRAGTFVIAAYPGAPPAAQAHTCAAR